MRSFLGIYIYETPQYEVWQEAIDINWHEKKNTSQMAFQGSIIKTFVDLMAR